MGKTWADKHMDNYSDDRLIALIRSGDGNAFNTLSKNRAGGLYPGGVYFFYSCGKEF